jgi:hypothetical protein
MTNTPIKTLVLYHVTTHHAASESQRDMVRAHAAVEGQRGK